LELIWTVLTAILFIGLNLAGAKAWSEQRFAPAAADAIKVEVTGVQFAWYFRYPGPDGKFAKVDPANIDASAGNEAALGLDTNDPAAKDDIVSGTMVLPVDREIEIELRAQDVIHSFYVPAMRFKQDAVPGLIIPMHFRPTQIGEYEFACAELCGLGHYKMHGVLRVVSQQDYDKWLQERETEKASQ
jgi:cytochrome c oxidase subunit 2